MKKAIIIIAMIIAIPAIIFAGIVVYYIVVGPDNTSMENAPPTNMETTQPTNIEIANAFGEVVDAFKENDVETFRAYLLTLPGLTPEEREGMASGSAEELLNVYKPHMETNVVGFYEVLIPELQKGSTILTYSTTDMPEGVISVSIKVESNTGSYTQHVQFIKINDVWKVYNL